MVSTVNDLYGKKRENHYITLSNSNKFTKDILDTKMKNDNLVNESVLNEKKDH